MEEIEIRECTTIEEFDSCVALQREAFGLPDMEISPRRHLIVSRQAGGWTLAAFVAGRMIGFVHQLAAVRPNNEIYGYSHMMAVTKDYQNKGIGARLKWAQRERALAEGRTLIKWTWDPMQARNAHFNLNRLGVIVDSFGDNFYGTDYFADPTQALEDRPGLQSDRLFARWDLKSSRVAALGSGMSPAIEAKPVVSVSIPSEWNALVKRDTLHAREVQARVRSEFKEAFARGLVCAALERGDVESKYLLFEPQINTDRHG
ncbi:MAG TPA: GNAT family N-acetyltransferase [Pyrinomonadaceae bacterium]|nr:GNAT family N-acetyltransferase [Pyrinomonadaceae bacterium]